MLLSVLVFATTSKALRHKMKWSLPCIGCQVQNIPPEKLENFTTTKSQRTGILLIFCPSLLISLNLQHVETKKVSAEKGIIDDRRKEKIEQLPCWRKTWKLQSQNLLNGSWNPNTINNVQNNGTVSLIKAKHKHSGCHLRGTSVFLVEEKLGSHLVKIFKMDVVT